MTSDSPRSTSPTGRALQSAAPPAEPGAGSVATVQEVQDLAEQGSVVTVDLASMLAQKRIVLTVATCRKLDKRERIRLQNPNLFDMRNCGSAETR